MGDWDSGTDGEDIFWYGSGGGTESIWRGSTVVGTFGVSTAPQVNGTDYRVAAFGEAALFYRPGPATDYIWEGIAAGASAPTTSIQTTINKVYEPHAFGFDNILLYGPGTATDKLTTGYDDAGSLETVDGTINGTYRVAVSGSRVITFHAPGPAQDYLWVLG